MNKSIIQFLISLKNASFLKKEYITIKYSKKMFQIVENLYSEGFIQSYKIKDDNLYILLRYFFNKPILKNLRIISTPSKFRYLNLKTIYKLPNKKSILFLSTPKGILTLSQCKLLKIGGKALFYC
jgi:small subunit ribosomal protein S8